VKFLVTCRPAAPLPVPPEQAIHMVEAAVAWYEAQLASGAMECAYLIPDRGGIAVLEAESADHLLKTLLAQPAYPLYHWAVQPLVEWRTGFDGVLAHLRGAADRAERAGQAS